LETHVPDLITRSAGSFVSLFCAIYYCTEIFATTLISSNELVLIILITEYLGIKEKNQKLCFVQITLSKLLGQIIFTVLPCILILSSPLFIQLIAQVECSRKMLKLTLKCLYLFRLHNHHQGVYCCTLLKL